MSVSDDIVKALAGNPTSYVGDMARELLALREAMKEPVAWLIEYQSAELGFKTRQVAFVHNAIGDFHDLDPNA